ncbi:MAG: prephenate dehydrogenase/arogenate dehydrogenase family protein [Pseudomonadota bacterium]
MYPADTLGVIGLGLIGGSLAKALRDSGFCRHFIGYGHRESSLRRGLELGVIDRYTLSLQELVATADIIVVCAPTLASANLLGDLIPLVKDRQAGPVITDAASVKGGLQAAALAANDGIFPRQLVLGHPIAGSERSGVDASDADLFRDHRVILTPLEANDPEAVQLVRAMWQSTGAEVVDMGVAEHDAVLASTSHLPHVLAYALVDALASSRDSDAIFRFAAGGFRDFTRIASSDPVMWRDIALANREALLDAIDDFSVHLNTLRTAVAEQDAQALQAVFERAKKARDDFAALLEQRARS